MRDPRLDYLDAVLAAVPRPCRRALDVGCGEGEMARRLAGRAERVVGIDLSAEMVAQAGALSPRHPNVELLHGSFLDHPFPAEDFDFVVAVASLHHMDLAAGLTALARVLRPGGTLAEPRPADDSLMTPAPPAGRRRTRRG